MTTTPASTSPTWSTAITRLRFAGCWIGQHGARLLSFIAVTIATVVALFSMLTAAATLYRFAMEHETDRAGAIMFTATVLGLFTVVTATAWRARLHARRLSRLPWALWWITVAVGLAATAAAVPHDWVARGINTAPVAALAALAGLVTRPQRP